MHLKLFYFTELYSNDYIIYYNKYYLIIIVMIIKIIIILSKIRTRHNNFFKLIIWRNYIAVQNTEMTNGIAYSLSSYYYFSKPWDPYFFHLQTWRQHWFVYWPSVPFPWCLPTAAVTCVWPLTRHVNRNVVTLSPTPISMTSVPPHVPHSVPSVTPNAMAAVANKRSEFQTICVFLNKQPLKFKHYCWFVQLFCPCTNSKSTL